MKKIIFILAIASFFTSCYRNVESIKIKAPAFLKERGYIITSFDGYESDIIGEGLFTCVVKDSTGFIYSLEILELGGELYITNQKCLNAVSKK
jgi:hypothetical protein